MNWLELLGFGSIIDFEKEDEGMEKEEMIERLVAFRNGWENPKSATPGFWEEVIATLNETVGDAISREDALMALTGEYMESPIEILPKAIKRINALPPVTPAEKVSSSEKPNEQIPVMYYPQVEGITPTVVEPSYNSINELSSSEKPNEQMPIMYYPQVEGITPTVVEPSYNSINALSSSENPNKWIPANQPPKVSGRYLVSMRYVTHDVVETASYSTDLHRVDEYDFPKHEAGWYNYDSEYGYYKIENVIVAYMPLPEPYKAESEG